MSRRTLIFINRVYRPNEEATASYLSDLALGLAKQFDVRVVCATPNPARDEGPTRVVRRPPPALPLPNKFRKVWDYAWFLSVAVWQILIAPRGAAVIAWTDPPFLDTISGLLCWVTNRPFYGILQDCFPELIERAGLLRDGALMQLLVNLHCFALRRAKNVICISEDTRVLFASKGLTNLVVIPNWCAGNDIHPVKEARDARWRATEFADRFIIKYAGNVGYACDLDSFEAALAELPDSSRYLFVLQIGGRQVQRAKALANRYSCVQIGSLVPRSDLNKSLAECDAHLILTPEPMLGMVFASKLYTAMAAAKPVLASLPKNSEMHSIISGIGAGVTAPAGNAKAFASAMEQLRAQWAVEPEKFRAQGQNGREYITTGWNSTKALERYAQILAK